MSETWHEFPQHVQAAALKAAADVHRRWGGLEQLDDLKQEALLFLATHAETAQRYLDDPDRGVNYVGWYVFSELNRRMVSLHKTQGNSVQFEKWAEPWVG